MFGQVTNRFSRLYGGPRKTVWPVRRREPLRRSTTAAAAATAAESPWTAWSRTLSSWYPPVRVGSTLKRIVGSYLTGPATATDRHSSTKSARDAGDDNFRRLRRARAKAAAIAVFRPVLASFGRVVVLLTTVQHTRGGVFSTYFLLGWWGGGHSKILFVYKRTSRLMYRKLIRLKIIKRKKFEIIC